MHGTKLKRPKGEGDKPHEKQSPNPHSSKRNRISFVCQVCRRSKTKCDRGKPSCLRCLKLGLSCIYDVEQQTPPKTPSKDAMIMRLRREAEYWQKRAMDLGASMSHVPSETSSLLAPPESATQADFFEHGTVSESSLSQQSRVPRPDQIMINLYKPSARLLVTAYTSQELKPSSDVAQVRSDTFLCLFFTSFLAWSNKNALISSVSQRGILSVSKGIKLRDHTSILREQLYRYCANDIQRSRVDLFTTLLEQGTGHSTEANSGIFVKLLNSSVRHFFIEGSRAENEPYTQVLTELITQIEATLPPYCIVKQYLFHFYQYVYPFMPCLEISFFDSLLIEILIEDPSNPEKIKLNLGRDRLRAKVTCLATLFLVLGITYKCALAELSAFELFDSSSSNATDLMTMVKEHPVTNDMIIISQKCLTTLNIFNWPTEDALCCLLHLWTYFAISPESGDVYYGQSTEFIMGLITIMATNMGLHRDPSEYVQLTDKNFTNPRMLNYRRNLWTFLSTLNFFEATLKGRGPQAMTCKNSFLNDCLKLPGLYSERISRDSVDQDPIELKTSAWNYGKFELFAMIAELNKISSNLEDGLSLDKVEDLMQRIDNHLNLIFNLEALENAGHDQKLKIPSKLFSSAEINVSQVQKVYGLHGHLLGHLVLFRISFALFLHFEKEYSNNSANYRVYYERFLMNSFSRLIYLLELYDKLYGGKIAKCFPSFTAFMTDKAMQMCLNTMLFSLISMILRFTRAEASLGERHSPSALQEDSWRKREKFKFIRQNLERVLERLTQLTSRYLRITFFPVFKMSLLMDYIVKIIKGNDTLGIIDKVAKTVSNDRVHRDLFLKFGLDIKCMENVRQELDHSNFLNDLHLDLLNSLQNLLHKAGFSTTETKQQVDPFYPDREEELTKNEKTTFIPMQNQVPDSYANDKYAGVGNDSIFDSNLVHGYIDYLDFDFLFKDGM
ncbi:LAMI_0F05182g1_1 [Lachancea mirantina]|uniref:LAMI_0F05182g1_1 n=1 Tax=Lachancea mirantina TaxID=1230905 RepID=A0A1G4JYC3_9SACH|nr:LAMI_0F05182g1_1 [Lachancea mirantina]